MSKARKPLEPSDILIEHFPDRSIRRLLQYPEYVRGLVEIIAPELVALLDFSRGVQQNRSFISDALRERESDVLLHVPFQEAPDSEELLIYILIEHQSTVDPTMGFRLLSYMMEIWQEQWRAWQSGTGERRRLDPILPIVFYTGDRRWTSPLSLMAIMEVPEILERFVPTFDTLFLRVKTADQEALTKPGHPLGWLLSVLQKENAEKSAISEALVAAVSALSRLDELQVSQVRQALLYFIQLILHRRSAEEREELIELVKRHSHDESEVVIMAQTAAELLIEHGIEQGRAKGIEQGKAEGIEQGKAEGIEQGKAEGIEQGKAEGIEQGIIEGKRAAILQLLRFRFQNVPEMLTDRVTSINSLSHLDTLLEAAMTAQSLDEIQV